MRFTRRELIGAGIAGLAANGLPLPPSAKPKKAKNIIFCVADGMGIATLSMADQFQKIHHGRSSYWAQLLDQPDVVNALQETRSLNSLVTDSSAASSAWGSGRHIWNGQVNMFPDGTKLRTIANLMHSVGVRCGFVTTTTITHATPAGFGAQRMQRDMEEGIAEDYLAEGIEVIMGGGDKFLSATARKDKRDLYADFARAGYSVVRHKDELAKVRGGKVLGVFGLSHLPFTVDRDNDPALIASVPTLAEMAARAISLLKGSRNGFLLQIEGGKVDHGNHANDLAAAVYDQIAFEEAVRVAVEFARKDGETLVVITADHATGGPALNGDGKEYIDSTAGLKTLARMRASYTPLIAEMGLSASPARVREVVEARLGIQLTADEGAMISEAIAGKWRTGGSKFERSVNSALGIVLGNHSRVQWTGGNHTSDHVLVTALGPGSEAFAGLTENIRMFDLMLAHKDLKWSNPTMSFADAAQHYEKIRGQVAREALHWE